jgi:hypothetical protein
MLWRGEVDLHPSVDRPSDPVEWRSVMTRTIAILTVLAGTALPLCASAQQADAAYCSKLGQAYERYVGDNEAQHRGQQRDATVTTAISKCSTDSATSIPVIEKALTDAKITLPPRT